MGLKGLNWSSLFRVLMKWMRKRNWTVEAIMKGIMVDDMGNLV